MPEIGWGRGECGVTGFFWRSCLSYIGTGEAKKRCPPFLSVIVTVLHIVVEVSS